MMSDGSEDRGRAPGPSIEMRMHRRLPRT